MMTSSQGLRVSLSVLPVYTHGCRRRRASPVGYVPVFHWVGCQAPWVPPAGPWSLVPAGGHSLGVTPFCRGCSQALSVPKSTASRGLSERVHTSACSLLSQRQSPQVPVVSVADHWLVLDGRGWPQVFEVLSSKVTCSSVTVPKYFMFYDVWYVIVGCGVRSRNAGRVWGRWLFWKPRQMCSPEGAVGEGGFADTAMVGFSVHAAGVGSTCTVCLAPRQLFWALGHARNSLLLRKAACKFVGTGRQACERVCSFRGCGGRWRHLERLVLLFQTC